MITREKVREGIQVNAEIEKDYFPVLYKERCTECETRRGRDDIFCANCGGGLNRNKAPVGMVMMAHCSGCGHPNVPGGNFCVNCGNPMR